MKEKSCGAVIYKIDNSELNFLILKQTKGHHSFPKGHVENNETEEDTAIREIKEETNLDVNIDTNFRMKIDYLVKDNKVKKEVIFFIATPISFNLKCQEGEVESCYWYSYNEALNILEYDNYKDVLKKAYKYIKKS